MSPDLPNPSAWSRRKVLATLGAAGAVGAGGVIVGSRFRSDPEDAPTRAMDADRARDLAEQFAPDLYFDTDERWYPTDPRPYTSTDGDRTIVEGVDALDGYTRDFSRDDPPRPTLFYNGRRYVDSTLGVVQFWMYSVFDQFATNFHWHDWEVLHVFVDLETAEPALYIASAHSRSVPNNEFLDPETRPAILPELGSHSSGLSVNRARDQFQRFPGSGDIADVTNRAVDVIETLTEFPMAYGLPRDEGLTLGFALPELDGRPLPEHPSLPAVERADLLPPELTIGSYRELAAPPDDLPERTTGLTFGASTDRDVDLRYELVPSDTLEHIDGFTGQQLSFEFYVPQVAEDAIASHITTSGTPWAQPRYRNPAADITEPAHRQALANRYAAIDYGGPGSALAGAVRRVVEDESAPDDNGVTTTDTSTTGIALLQSDPMSAPTSGPAVAFVDLPDGEHRLTVNAPGMSPYSERVDTRSDDAGGGTIPAGSEGAVAMVTNRDAVKIDGDASDGPDLAEVAVEDDFGGRLWSFRPDSPDAFAVYVHRGGAYATEIVDQAGEKGAYRINPDPDEVRRHIPDPQTGKAPLAAYVADLAGETAAQASDFDGSSNGGRGDEDRTATPIGMDTDADDIQVSDGLDGVVRALEASAFAARTAAQRAEAGDGAAADEALQTTARRLERVRDAVRINEAGLSTLLQRVLDRRLAQADRRVQEALAARTG